MRRALTAATVLAGLLALACFGGGDDDEFDLTQLLTPTPTPSVATATPSPSVATATPSPTATATSAPTAPATRSPPVPTATPTATAAPPPAAPPAGGDVEGAPFSTADARAAIEGAGVTFIPLENRAAICSSAATVGQHYWTARPRTDFGPAFVLWVYPDVEALQADWAVEPGEPPQPLVAGCELPTGFVYWNGNLILTFAFWLSVGAEIPFEDHPESLSDHATVQAFLELTP